MKKEKIVLAYSGGLDTSIAIQWLQEKYHYEVIALAADVGEGKDLETVKEKALKIGAVQCYVKNVQEEFANQYIAQALKANALYEEKYPLISALSRPLIAKLLVEVAAAEEAVAVSHGCTGKGNDQVRFDVAVNTLNPDLKIIAPVRESPMSREESIAYATSHQIAVPIQKENPFSIDLNLWGRSCECGVLEDPWVEPPEHAFAWTIPISQAPDQPEYLEIEFHQGLPVAYNQQPMSLVEMIKLLNQRAGQHGVGRIDHVENRLIGIKSREIYEAPAALTLIAAHQALESLCLTRDTAHFKKIIEQKFANMVYDGLWYSPLFAAVNAFLNKTQETVNGVVKIKLFKGNAIVVGRRSAQSLYQRDLATYTDDDTFDHHAAEGFITVWGLPLKVHARVNYPKGKKA